VNTLWKALALVATIWVVVAAGLFFVGRSKPTPERLMAYLETQPLKEATPDARVQILERVSRQLTAIPYETRREAPEMRRAVDRFFRELTPAEQSEFLDRTLPVGFTQMMEALNKMDPERRKRLVDRALENLQKGDGRSEEERALSLDDPNVRKIIENGVQSFYKDANAQTKLDLAPLLETIQRQTQNLR